MLSRRKSFHHKKEERAKIERGNKTSNTLSLRFKYNTMLLITQKRRKETITGQRDDWTARKGDEGTISLVKETLKDN